MMKIRDITAFTALLFLLITTTAAATKIDWYPSSSVLVKINDPSVIKHGRISADLLDDGQLAVATPIMNSDNVPVNISVQLVGPNSTINECVIPYFHLTLSPRRLNQKIVLIFVDVYDERGLWQVKILLVNMKNCKYNFAHKGVIRDRPGIMPMSDNSSDVKFVATLLGKNVCENHDLCRFFDPQYRRYDLVDYGPHFGYLQRFEPASTSNVDLFVGRFADDFGTHRARLYDLSSNRTGNPLYKDLFTIVSDPKAFNGSIIFAFTQYTVVSSGLSFCWNSRLNRSVVHCSKFREDGSMMFNKTIVQPEFSYINGIVSIPNGLVLFTKEKIDDILQANVITPRCNDCSDLLSTSRPIADDMVRVKTARYSLPCENHLLTFKVRRMDESSDEYEVQYLCKSSRAISLGIIYI